jgi:hypothetical protein
MSADMLLRICAALSVDMLLRICAALSADMLISLRICTALLADIFPSIDAPKLGENILLQYKAIVDVGIIFAFAYLTTSPTVRNPIFTSISA